MNDNSKKTLERVGYTALGVTALLGVGVLGYVVLNQPTVVKHPCFRTFNRADGVPKKAFVSRIEVNMQSVKQLIRYGEVCIPYKANGLFYTGHSKSAWVRSFNFFK